MRMYIITVKGSKWRYRLTTHKEFVSTHGDSAMGITEPPKKLITIDESALCLGIVRHELRHAYTTELLVDSADLTANQMEEIQCEVDQHHWEEMDKKARKMYENLKSSKKEGRDVQDDQDSVQGSGHGRLPKDKAVPRRLKKSIDGEF